MKRWAKAAYEEGLKALRKPSERRHGGTWFVGVDALPNASDGSVNGVPLAGTWLSHVTRPVHWHRAQLSVVFPGYPQRDRDESEAAHRYRRDRDAAHVDGLLPEGRNRRRHLREPHAFIAGLPLNTVTASPLVVWSGSHDIMRAAFADAFSGHTPSCWGNLDITEIYQVTRRRILADCPRVEVTANPGQVVLLDRHLLHGVAPWGEAIAEEGRMIAYFRPMTTPQVWLHGDRKS